MTGLSRRQFLMAAGAFWAEGTKPKFSGEFGLEIYSLRREAEKDLPATLAMIRKFGFREVEVSSLYGHSATDFRQLLDDAGLKATSMMADHARLTSQIDAVAGDAYLLGAEYVV